MIPNEIQEIILKYISTEFLDEIKSFKKRYYFIQNKLKTNNKDTLFIIKLAFPFYYRKNIYPNYTCNNNECDYFETGNFCYQNNIYSDGNHCIKTLR